MSLIDDLLRIFGTNRVRLRWKWDNFRKGMARTAGPPVEKPRYMRPPAHKRVGRALSWLLPAEFPIMTVLFLTACIGLFIVTVKISHDVYGETMAGKFSPARLVQIRYGALDGARVLDGDEWWRLVTANFLHGGLIHIVMNGLALWTLGQVVEQTFGRSRFVFVYLVTGVAGYALTLVVGREQAFSVGASAAIFGLMGLVIAHGLSRGGRYKAEIKERFIPWLLYGVIFSFLPGINLWAHLGGGLAGALLGLVLAEKDRARRLPDPLWAGIAIGCFAVIGWAFWRAAQTPVPY